VHTALPLVRALQQLGMPPYACQPPTGYEDTAEAWVNTGALVTRMNIALALASDRIPGIALSRPPGADNRQPAALDSRGTIERILNDDVSDSTRATIEKATMAAQITALTLGSPEFQRR
jgi:uncharacterized protein (DUF1800 family)